MQRNRIAFFNPEPELVPELARLSDLHVFDSIPDPFRPAEFDYVIYRIGNDVSHRAFYECALQHPGIVVLDESNLHELVRPAIGDTSETYIREIFYEIFGREWTGVSDPSLEFSGQQPRSFSFMRRLLLRSRACIVRSRYGEAAVRMKGFRGPVARIIFGAQAPQRDLQTPVTRNDLRAIVQAMAQGRVVLVPDTGANRELPDDACVKIPCDAHFEKVRDEVLKWLLSNPEAMAEIANNAALWVQNNCGWAHIAQRYVEFLTQDAPESPALDNGNIRSYLARWIEPDTPAGAYFQEHEDRLIHTVRITPPGEQDARILEMGCYMQITPALRALLGYGTVRGCYLGEPGSALKIANSRDGDFFECAIDTFDCERDCFPYPDDYFSTVLCCELLEHLERDPMRTMIEIRRVLRTGGALVLTTPNIVSARSVIAVLEGNHPGFYTRYPDPRGSATRESRHQREYTPGEIARLLSAAGFALENIETGPYGPADSGLEERASRVIESLGKTSIPRGDCIFAVARKVPATLDSFPAWLYDSA